MNDYIIDAVNRAQDGDKDALGILHKEFSKQIYYKISAVSDNQDNINEIYRDVFATAMNNINGLKSPDNFESWLNEIASNKIKNHQSCENNNFADITTTNNIEDFDEYDADRISEITFDNAEIPQKVYEIIQTLPISQRACIHFYYFEKLSIKEIANQLAVNEEVVKTYISSANKKIREELEKRGEKEGLRLWMATPLAIVPILKFAFQNTKVPETLTNEIVNNLGITTPLTEASSVRISTVETGAVAAKTTFSVGKIIFAVMAGLTIIGGVVTGAILLNAPPKPLDEQTIINYLKNDLNRTLEDEEIIDEITITERETEVKDGVDNVIAKVETNINNEVGFIKYYRQQYLIENKEWTPGRARAYREDSWTIFPLAGAKDELIIESIMGTYVIADDNQDDIWFINKETIGNVAIVERNTALKDKTDSAYVLVEILDEVLMATGQMCVELSFDENWSVDDFNVSTPFTTSYRQGMALDVTDDDLITLMTEQNLIYVQSDVPILADEISDFSLQNRTIANRGKTQYLSCEFILNKPVITFYVKADIIYQFESSVGWQAIDIVLTVDGTRAEALEGRWHGQYNSLWSGVKMRYVDLDIYNNEGFIEAMFNYYELDGDPDDPIGIYSATIEVDFETEMIIVRGKTWIKQPFMNSFANFKGILSIEGSETGEQPVITLSNDEQGNGFTSFYITKIE